MSQLPSVVSKPKEKPSWTYVGTHIGTHALGLGRLSVSKGDSQDLRKNLGKESKIEEESRDLTQDDSNGHFPDGGSCGWIRTNDLEVNSQGVKDNGTHIGTHKIWNELKEVKEKWPKLPKEIRDAILAIVRSAAD